MTEENDEVISWTVWRPMTFSSTQASEGAESEATRLIINRFREYKEIWLSVLIVASFSLIEFLTKTALLKRGLISSRRLARWDEDLLELAVIFLILAGGIVSYKWRRVKRRDEIRILKAVLVTLQHEVNNGLTVIEGNIAILLRSENRSIGENKAAIRRIEAASQKIHTLIIELSRLEQIELGPYLKHEEMIDRARSLSRPEKILK